MTLTPMFKLIIPVRIREALDIKPSSKVIIT